MKGIKWYAFSIMVMMVLNIFVLDAITRLYYEQITYQPLRAMDVWKLVWRNHRNKIIMLILLWLITFIAMALLIILSFENIIN